MPVYPANPILVIDDNAVSLRTLAAVLRAHGISHLWNARKAGKP